MDVGRHRRDDDSVVDHGDRIAAVLEAELFDDLRSHCGQHDRPTGAGVRELAF